LEGLDIELGSDKEALAIRAFRHKQRTEFLKVKCVVEAIVYAGSSEVSKVNETLNALLGMLIPEVEEDKERRTEAMREKLDKLKDMGPISIRPMDEGGFKRRSAQRREEE
jgi:hypothetical protein